MKARKTLTLLLLAALTFAACKYDDSALWEQVNQNTEELAAQAARIAALEAWQAETNTNIQALQTLLSTTDYITAVTPVVKDGVEVGFTISFLNTPSITIYHGAKGDKGDKGDTPQIGAAQDDDGNWYWTLNGEPLTDADGNPIRANGTQGGQGDQGPAGDDAPLPQLATGTKLTAQGITTDTQNNAIKPDAIYLSVDGGQTWTRVSGEKGEQGDTGATGPKGDSFFKGIDTANADYILFTLADGSTFQVPRYTGISLSFDPESLSLLYGGTATIQCTAKGSAEFTTDNLFIVAPADWKADIALTRAASTAFTLTVTAPDTESTGEILVMLDNKKGSTTIGRIPVKTAGGIVGTELKADGLASGQIAALIGSRTDLTSVVLTNCNLSSQDWYAIVNNKSLVTIDLGESTYNNYSFSYVGNVIGNSTLQSLTVPAGVQAITTRGFYGCTKLTSATIPASVEQIQSNAFAYCGEMTTFTIPEDSKLTKIGQEAFVRCYKLESIFIPATVTTIGDMAFQHCTELTSITFAEGSQLTEIPFYCFAFNEALPSINLPAGLTSIGGYAFRSCTSLTSITIPDGVTSIGNYAFWCCKALPSITLPAKLESIGEWAFATCESLTSITIPDGVTSIGNNAFAYCKSLTTVTCLAETPPTLGSDTFKNSDALTIIQVPSASVDDYKAAQYWNYYADKIVAIPEP